MKRKFARKTVWPAASAVARASFRAVLLLTLTALSATANAADTPGADRFRKDIQPLMKEHCYECHADGVNKGNVSFDEFKSDAELLENRELWWKVLKNVRAGVMPPQKKPRPPVPDQDHIAQWIKLDVFGINPADPDPGRVTARRLNRVEYRNSIRDLVGIDFDTETEFPPDDTGFGFDNIGEVLTLSPMLLEKYLGAAQAIVAKAVPVTSRVVAERTLPSRPRGATDAESADDKEKVPASFSYYDAASVTNVFSVKTAGRYQLVLKLTASEKYVDNQFDLNRCRLIFKVDGQELLRKEFSRQENKPFTYEYDQQWQTGEHTLSFEVEPLTPDERRVRSLSLRVNAVTLRGPFEEKYWVPPKNYTRFFPKPVPESETARRTYAHELLGNFVRKAFRRPVDDQTVDQLTSLAEDVYRQPGKTFEAGVAHGMVAVLAAPRFLFREEEAEPKQPGQSYPFVDDYSLASRLSYFLWSSMPDDELLRLAAAGSLRTNLTRQVKRMLADSRSEALVQNFTGQWLQARDIETVVVDSRAVLAREERPDPELERLNERRRQLREKPPETLTPEEKAESERLRGEFFRRFRAPRIEFNGELRQSMRKETEKYFEYVLRQDRALVELIASDYTFLNERLAKHYGVAGVSGDEMRRVQLPPESPRGGILGQGTVLAVTSNPTRTSPVKRGLFILDNILGLPPPPPPPNIPLLEDAAKEIKGHEPSLRETLALHRAKPLCSSCHNRMDPLGLALENFNALGMWREKERDQPIDVAGKLITGESFTNVQQLKLILVTDHRRDFYRCLAEKLLTYALGRGLDYYDVESVDEIVARIETENGRFSALLMGVIESAPFQKRRASVSVAEVQPSRPVRQLSEVSVKP